MTNPTLMTRARLQELLDAYGADLARFPEHERQAAQALTERDPEAAALLNQARALDTLLDAAPAEPVTSALRARVAEIPIRYPRAEPDAWLDWLSWRGAVRLLLAGAIAAAIGAASTMLTVDEEILVASDDGWGEVTAIAFATGVEEEP